MKEVVLLLQGRIFPAWDEREIGVAGPAHYKGHIPGFGKRNAGSRKGMEKNRRSWKRCGEPDKKTEAAYSGFFRSDHKKKSSHNLRKLTETDRSGKRGPEAAADCRAFNLFRRR